MRRWQRASAQRALSPDRLRLLPRTGRGSTPFSHETLLEIARETARSPYVEKQATLPKPYQDLTAEQYNDIMFRSEFSSWKANRSQFSLNAHPCGFLYKTPVEIHIVEDGLATPLMVDGPAFSGPQSDTLIEDQIGLPYSGLSLSGPFPADARIKAHR